MEALLDERLNNIQKLRAIIMEPFVCNIYEEYLKNVFAWENFGFYIEVEKYKRAPEDETKYEIAKNIYNFYLNEEAVFKIGAASDEEIEEIFKNLEKIPPHVYDKLQLEAFIELANSTINEFIEHQLFYDFQDHYKIYGTTKSLFKRNSNYLMLI